jgi:hypothetical protein
VDQVDHDRVRGAAQALIAGTVSKALKGLPLEKT